MNMLEKLIALYGTKGLDAIEQNGQLLLDEFNVKTKEELALLPKFNETNNKVRQLAATIKKLISGTITKEEEVINILRYARERSFEDRTKSNYAVDMDIFGRLVRSSIVYTAWPENIKSHFENLYPKICSWFTYFLSYTNQNSLYYNKKYHKILSRLISVKEHDVKNSNLIAETTHILLKNHNGLIGGFYDKPKLDIGVSLEKIKDASSRSFVFVQISSKTSFTESDHTKNWCFVEFNCFQQSDQQLKDYPASVADRYLFLIDGEKIEDIRPAVNFSSYDQWFNFIPQRHFKGVGSTFKDYERNVNDLAKAIVSFIDKKIISTIPQSQTT